MKYEKEITVEVNMGLRELKEYLNNMNFRIKEEYDLNDIYMCNKSLDKSNDYLELLKTVFL